MASRYRASSSMVSTGRLYCRAYTATCSPRAIVPSGFISSHSTAAGRNPARRARSTEPSVWPRRVSTPPLRARSGNTCPGLTIWRWSAVERSAAPMVVMRSWADTPVVMPSAASMVTVKPVPWRAWLFCTMGASCSSSTVASSRHRQTMPLQSRIIMAMVCSEMFSAAAMMSASSSRSSSSSSSTGRPAWKAAMAALTLGNCGWCLVNMKRSS